MATIIGTDGNDFFDDGTLPVPTGFSRPPGATTDLDDFITFLGGDDIAHGGDGVDTGFLKRTLPNYDIFVHAGGEIDVVDRIGAEDGTKTTTGIEKLVSSAGTDSIDVSTPGVARYNSGSSSDTLTISGNFIGGVPQNWVFSDRGLFSSDLGMTTFEGHTALNLNAGSGDDTLEVGILAGLHHTIFVNSSGFNQLAPALTIDLGAGDDGLDATFLEISPPVVPVPNFFHLLALGSPTQVRMGAGDDDVDFGLSARQVTVADNKVGAEHPGINVVNAGNGPGNWIDASALGFATGEVGVSVNLETGLLTSSIVGHQTTLTGIDNVAASAGNDTVTGNDSANIVVLRTGTDHADLGGQGTAQRDMVAFSGANGGVSIDLEAGTASGGTGSGLVNSTFTGAEGTFGSNSGDAITGLAAGGNLVFGMGGNDDIDLGDGANNILGITGNREDYTVVGNPDGSVTISDDRGPGEFAPGSVSDGTDTVRGADFIRFADQTVAIGALLPAVSPASTELQVNLVDFSTGVLPQLVVGGPSDQEVVKFVVELAFASRHIELIPDEDIGFLIAVVGFDSEFKRTLATGFEKVDVDLSKGQATIGGRVVVLGDWEDTGVSKETLTFECGDNDDEFDASGVTSDHRVVVNAAGGADTLSGGAGADILNGGDDDDLLNGGSNGDALNGGAGFDSLFGSAGSDTLDGGANADDQGDILLGGLGNDVYHVDHGLDLVDEGIVFGGDADGVDEIISSADFFWDFYSAGDVIRVAADANDPGNDGTTIVGSVFSNFVVGNAKTNVMFGRGGADTYIAGDGIDFISLSLLGLTEENAYVGVDGVNTVIVEQRTSGPTSYDIVFEFESGKDKVDLSDYGFADAAAAFATGVDDGAGNAYFVLGDGLDYLYMVGLELADMMAGDFIV